MAYSPLSTSFLLLCVLLVATTVRGIWFGRGVFEFPVVTSMLGLAWVVPQGFEMERNGSMGQDNGGFWYYLTACFLLISVGFALGRAHSAKRRRREGGHNATKYDPHKLTIAAGGLTALGVVCFLMIRGTDTSGMEGGWSGIVTMYALLAGATAFGLCLSILIFARTRSLFALATAVISATPMVYVIMQGVRREVLFDLLVLGAGSYYLSKRRYPPRIAVVAFLLMGSFVLNSVGDIRAYVSSGQGNLFDAVLSGDLRKNFNYFELSQGDSSEVKLARYDFIHTSETGRFEYGGNYLNSIVSQYVPAFLVGREFKDSLKADTLEQRASRVMEGIAFSLGSTRTGFSDSYRSFGWLGAFVFGAIGYLFGRLYDRAIVGGVAAQYFYLILLGNGLKAVTHSTSEFVASLPFAVGISAIAFGFARVSAANQPQASQKSLIE